MKNHLVEKKSGTFSSFDGTSIYYELRGKGEPIVFVYGIACLINHWHHQISFFSENHRTIAFDLRGHHQSATPENLQNLTLDAIVEDISALLEHLKIEKAHIAGHSLGAPLVVKFAAKYPEKIQSITLINGFITNPTKGMFGLSSSDFLIQFIKSNYEKHPELWTTLWKLAVENPLSIALSGLAGGFNLRFTEMKDIEIYARGVAEMPLENFFTLFTDMMRYDGTEDASRIKKSTLVLAGEHDFVTPVAQQRKIHELIPKSTFTVVPYGSHCCQLDFPDYVNLKMEKHMSVSTKAKNPS